MRVFALAALIALSPGFARAADGDAEKALKLVEEAGAAYQAGKSEEAVALAKKAIDLDAKNPAAFFVLGSAHLKLRQNDEAAKAFTQVIALDPKAVAVHDRRGDAELKSGKFKEAVADFDKYLEANPKFAPEHWRRGIALYYAGRYKDGVAQFDLHRKVNPEDVENSAWHYLCNARANTPKKAREDLIPVSKDGRVPMKQVLELYAGKLKPQDVIDAAEKAKLDGEDLKEARFYANLYVALFYESEGDDKKALEHMTAAVEKYKIGHYMWDVADAHLKLVKAKK
ncbi:tetratricopeptide tpr_1 repeat-containing protein : Tetratricopeptide domain protein OS=Pirellula staleyi (strain ATCC 27377 / DSM 6068 / ICPB 4128) GN=Psta_3954 PE=4 SV=1: TPR_11: TPR_2 [Gemmataceae bacterium]|nr:tetratricopeptide tpr_1 repeat-containing protein : Tetratricopeptide domain protein OS=Pirellula staleyi (strain ATCC 27377 / DSM 6068 / ICPB 4128) GN=Psta_3954 PE=4 SV=1: TPR_11: TPR_2 [Gemmataceae bacterium]VTU00542.1 tetratricopeptide tpr_1 repeat-containing protein : Tetratricopeptide domain protein OS=Pirellula staleyi (strain ATCC 27377 / DSM 6068 / ICPB 4128) GN=Psta_3954 PE=4 SV=1: TPR_11: TPR_2 [Gemmataceae bacterium]